MALPPDNMIELFDDTKSAQIFISHRHNDKPIADVIRKNLVDWGHRSIFQSSDARHGPRVGAPLDESLKSALSDARVVFLIYTFKNYDWSWCMWECGAATNLASEKIRIITLQCTEDVPTLFEGQRRVRVNENDIHTLVTQFHREPEFFPEYKPFDEGLDDTTILRRSERFFAELEPIVPAKKLEERYRWDYLKLELDSDSVSMIRNTRYDDIDESIDIVKSKCKVVEHFGHALRHFGLESFGDSRLFGDLVDIWKTEVQRLPDYSNMITESWLYDLYNEIIRGVNGRPAVTSWNYMRSVVPRTDWWFHLIVNHVRVKPDDSMQFIIYMYEAPNRHEQE